MVFEKCLSHRTNITYSSQKCGPKAVPNDIKEWMSYEECVYNAASYAQIGDTTRWRGELTPNGVCGLFWLVCLKTIDQVPGAILHMSLLPLLFLTHARARTHVLFYTRANIAMLFWCSPSLINKHRTWIVTYCEGHSTWSASDQYAFSVSAHAQCCISIT